MKKNNRFILATLLLLFICFKLSIVTAQTEIADSIVTERILFLKNTLEKDRINTKRWWYGWIAGYSAATIGQGIVYFNSNDKSTRQDMALGAATTFLGVAGQFITPLIPGNEPEKLLSFSENTSEERTKKMIFAEKLLNDVAKREKLARNWKNHALTGAVNLGSGLITWLGFKRDIWAGVGNFALNTIITEAQIWTQPTLAKRKYQNYCLKYNQHDSGTAFLPSANWYFSAYAGGFSLKVVF